MQLNGNRDAVFEQIATLSYHDVAVEQIAAAVGCSVEEIEKIRELADYKEFYGKKVVEEFEKGDVKNQGYDEIEALAIGGIIDYLQWTKDPDFMLKAAMVANKANRRHVANKPITAGPDRIGVTIALQQTFVTRLQQYGDGQRPARDIDQKKQDFLDAEKVEKILGFLPGQKVLAPAE